MALSDSRNGEIISIFQHDRRTNLTHVYSAITPFHRSDLFALGAILYEMGSFETRLLSGIEGTIGTMKDLSHGCPW